MKTISALRFALWVTLVTAWCLSLMLEWTMIATVLMGASSFLLIDQRDYKNDKLSAGEGRRIIFTLATMALILCAVYQSWSEQQILAVISHPAVVIPTWLFLLFITFRRWKRDRLRQTF